ncbi:hypothetical protein ACCT09_37895, partial [Rhizobium ruizarguesonis]
SSAKANYSLSAWLEADHASHFPRTRIFGYLAFAERFSKSITVVSKSKIPLIHAWYLSAPVRAYLANRLIQLA